jgi:hypothetical protein
MSASRTILQAIRDIRTFVLIVLLILVSFAVAITVLNDLSLDENALLDMFGLMQGAFEVETYAVDLERSPVSVMLHILFYAFSLLVAIVLLNLLIAILGDSYDVVSEKKKAEYVRMRAQLVIEYARVFPCALRQRGRWLHVLMRTALANEQRGFSLDEEGTVDDEWNSRLTQLKASTAAMRRDVDELRHHTDDRIESVRAAMAEGIEDVRLELGAKLDTIIEQLGRVQQTAEPAAGASAHARRSNMEDTMVRRPLSPVARGSGDGGSLPGVLNGSPTSEPHARAWRGAASSLGLGWS